MKKIIQTLILSLLSVSLLAQSQIEVTGRVVDGKGEPLAGVAVMVKGSAVGVITDLDGRYSIKVPEGAVLVASCISYKNSEVTPSAGAECNIVLQDDAEQLDEVVVVGYGAIRRSDLTGSVASVKIDEEEASRATSIDQMLQGKAAGVQIVSNSGSPDAASSIRVRGLGSFNSDSSPLFVIDGVILNSPTQSETLITALPGSMDEESNGLLGLNPQDIANIEILKDASATAIYGALGANGVILITTRSATKDKPVVTASVGVDVASRYKRMDILGFDEYVEYLGKMHPEGLNRIYSDPVNKEGLLVQPVDWQDFVMRTAISKRAFVSVSARPSSFAYNFSFGYNDKQGIIKNSGVTQYTARLNLDKKFSDKVKIGLKVNFAYVDGKLTQGASVNQISAASSMIRSMLSYVPYMIANPEIEEDEDVEDEEEDERKSGPDRWLSNTVNTRKQYRVTPNAFLSWKIVNWLTFKSSLGVDYRNDNRVKFMSREVNRYSDTGSIGAISKGDQFTLNFDNTLAFNRKFYGGHTLSGTLGISAMKTKADTQTIEGWGIEQYKSMEKSINSAPNTINSYGESGSSTLSYFLRAIYNYKDRYVLTATYRIDGSSKFSKANRYSHFPSFAFAWRLNQEPWFKTKLISAAKIRAGWGRVGNQKLSNYQTTTVFSNGLVPSHIEGNDLGASIALYPSNFANPDLKWETTEQFNIGLDYGMWGGRLALTVDAYYKKTKDLLQQKNIAYSSGFSRMWVNQGSISNKGIEFSVDATPLKTKDFEWSFNGNLSLNRNRIESIDATVSPIDIFITKDRATPSVFFYGSSIGSGGLANYPGSIFIEGQPMGLFYGFATDGIVQQGCVGVPTADGGSAPKEGAVNYLDLNGNGYIDDDDRAVIGNPNPDFTYGFGTTFSYKTLSLGLTFTGSYGNDIMNINAIAEDDIHKYNNNHSRRAYYNAWTADNPNTGFPSLSGSKDFDRVHISDRCIEDGSYLRLASVSLSYGIPLKNKKVLKGVSLSASAQNLFVWTRYSGWDPDVNSYGSNVLRMAMDVGSYPSARTFTFNVKFTF